MTEPTASQRLAAALRDDTLSQLTGIEGAQVDQLLGLVEAERGRRADALTDAIDGGLGMVPKPLRGVVKRLVFP